jgi:membrane protein implicated in regulation of membrane protease activity
VLFVLAVLAAVLWIEGTLGWVLVGIAAVVEVGETFFWVWWSGKRRRAKVGAETLLGLEAVVVTACRPEGQVRVQGEIWRARCEERAGPGDRVVVESVDGLTLRVRPIIDR